MKTLGLIGGMSWESTTLYYQHINNEIKRRKGGLHSAPLILYSVDFAEIARLQHAGDWAALGQKLAQIGGKLAQAGADGLIICTNTMHYVADEVSTVVRIPLLHIGDAIAAACQQQEVETVGLLGTRFTMEAPFLRQHLHAAGLTVMTPDEQDRQRVHDVIYQELCVGYINPDSRQQFQTIVSRLAREGAQAVILGCTEIGLLLGAGDVELPLLDTTQLHANAAVDFMLAD
ncbi:aspartate/glutamate racemase family protein [Alteromonas gilva]|uniref:Aspartate/glutamate racemase family protein n=1 Tax=Alteromonas gilva TaxID=2987522 RepID=A0ABT5KZ93_9ALTE|nr:aspartate/glutamate racemase family protein [Alteromonas gilva]MDC8830089.1 aspartate/glutamate racemase family protein [Alteromonas gilva]